MVDSGIRGIVSPSMMDTWLGDEPGPVITTTDEALAEVTELRNAFHGAGDGRISVCPAPFTDLTASPELLSASAELAREWGSILQIHLCETLEGVNLVKRRYGVRVFEHAEREGVFNAPGVVAAHCCWVSEPDIAIIKEYDVGIAYCPSCEAKMADGLPPVSRLVHEGVAVAIAIDATCVNNSADLLREAKVGTLLQKVAPPLDPELLPAEKALEMITIDAARALGLASEVGSLEVGKLADLIALRIDGPHYVPLVDSPRYTIINHLIYAASGADVSEVVVNGRHVVRDGVAVTVDERGVVESAHGLFADFMQKSGITSEVEEMRWSSASRDSRQQPHGRRS
jgi:5-methylthioadenosine/S-adenosylhomocysteine deaminase